MAAQRRSFTTGTFDAEARAAGDLWPDPLDVLAADAAAEIAPDSLHPTLRFGRFNLWPLLQRALQSLHYALAGEQSGEWFGLCERGALLFLRTVLLRERVGVPLFEEWRAPESTPRVCERVGEAFASFAHTDLRIADAAMYNVWVPLAEVSSEPLLLCAVAESGGGAWRSPSEKAHHLDPRDASSADWYHFDATRRGHAIIFPGVRPAPKRARAHRSAASQPAVP
jgi:hypothetical protein